MAELAHATSIPLSVCFTAYKDGDYTGQGEEYLSFSGCSVDTAAAMDPRSEFPYLMTLLCCETRVCRSGVFLVPLAGLYLLNLSVCSQDRKKVLISLRRNGVELGSLYDQNHGENHSNSMSSQSLLAHLDIGDIVQVGSK